MAKKTKTPSSASPSSIAPRLVNAMRYAALERRLVMIRQTVADPSNGLDQIGFSAFVELRSNAADVRVHDVCLWIKMIVPHALEKHRARHDLPVLPHQFLQDSKFTRLEEDRRLAAEHLTLKEIEDQLTVLETVRILVERLASREGVHPRRELGEGKWLDEIVVRAGLEPENAILDPPECGQH